MSIETDRSSALRWITESQLEWAKAVGLQIADGNRTSSIEANLFRPLHPETLKEFEVGKGDELGSVGRPGKMASLISSSALAVNVFDVWRGNSCAALCQALGVEPAYSVGGFEATYPTGLRGTDPHLDIELSAADRPVVAVESKFTEPYRSVTNSFRPSYFSSDRTWAGLSASRSLAERIADNEITFHSLHAAQLLKHAIGLTRTVGTGRFVLMYLWYRAPGGHGTLHQAEIERFADLVEPDFKFRSITYQELLLSISNGPDGWMTYVRERYLGHRKPDLR